MAYPVQSLPDGSIKMSDGTIQPPKGAISPRINLGMPSFTETPATSSGASFVNRQNSISKNII